MTAVSAHSAMPLRIEVCWSSRTTEIEYTLLQPQNTHRPLLVFLHEGLGSLSMWKDFPQLLCAATGCRGLVLSRWGYGESSPRPPHEAWQPTFMHEQAHSFLPAFFQALGIDTKLDKPWFFGHSDGGSIALLYAAEFPQRVGGLIVAAPHIFVEDLTIRSIEEARIAYETTDLRNRLARYHADVDSAFRGWNDVWLRPEFREWDIRPLLPNIGCPILALQGYNDEYGTMEQIEGIARAAPQTQLLKLHECGHSPHRDQPQDVIHAVQTFLKGHAVPGAGA